MITSRTRRLAVPIADLFVVLLREISLFDAVSDPVRLQAYTDRPPNTNVNVNANVNVVDNSTCNSVSQNSILQISTPLSSRFQKASNVTKRKYNDNDNNKNKNMNNNDNRGILNNKSNLVFNNDSFNVNNIIDTLHDYSTSRTSTSCDTSMLKLVEISKQNIMKSKFVVPVRKESSSLNIAEHSAKTLNSKNIVNNNKNRKKSEKEEVDLSKNQNLSNDVSIELKQKTKTNNDKSDAVVISSRDDQKEITKKSKKKTQKKDIESNTDIDKGTVEVLEVAKGEKKGKRKLKAIEEIKCTSDDDNDNNNNNDNNTNKKNNNNDNNYDNNKKSNLNSTKIMNTKVNSDNNKNKNKNGNKNNTITKEVKNKDKTNESDDTDIVHTVHPSDAIQKSNKVTSGKKEDSTTVEAAKNVPGNIVPTSLHRSEEGSLEEDVLSDDDSLCLGSDQENDEMEDKESVVKVKGKGGEEGEGDKDEKRDGVKRLTVSDDHHDNDHNGNSNNDIEDEDEEDDDDMFFAE